jgi:hypothetical protein
VLELSTTAYQNIQLFVVNLDVFISLEQLKPGDFWIGIKDLKESIDKPFTIYNEYKIEYVTCQIITIFFNTSIGNPKILSVAGLDKMNPAAEFVYSINGTILLIRLSMIPIYQGYRK